MKTKKKNKRTYRKSSKKFVTVAISQDVMLADQYASILKKNGINALVRNDYDEHKSLLIKLMVPSRDVQQATAIIEPINTDNDFFSSIYDLQKDTFTNLAG